MRLDTYDIETGINALSYEFVSVGPRGTIRKLVQFSPFLAENVFNLGFGDKNSATGELDDDVVSANGDTEKVLATVVKAVYLFCEAFPDTWLYATGSTPARTRLYRMGINKYFETAGRDFEIRGLCNGRWEAYRKGTDYGAFLIKRKRSKFDL